MIPLFLPLKTAYYEQFKAGTKDTEYRRFGRRWNEETCAIGRRVVVSCGYGKAHRLEGVVVGFKVSRAASLREDWIACYGEGLTQVACIQIEVKRE